MNLRGPFKPVKGACIDYYLQGLRSAQEHDRRNVPSLIQGGAINPCFFQESALFRTLVILATTGFLAIANLTPSLYRLVYVISLDIKYRVFPITHEDDFEFTRMRPVNQSPRQVLMRLKSRRKSKTKTSQKVAFNSSFKNILIGIQMTNICGMKRSVKSNMKIVNIIILNNLIKSR